MAKVTEGDPYYYAPSTSGEINYCIFKRSTHPNQECLAVDVSQDSASLIVDALNFHHHKDKILDIVTRTALEVGVGLANAEKK